MLHNFITVCISVVANSFEICGSGIWDLGILVQSRAVDMVKTSTNLWGLGHLAILSIGS